MKVLRLWWVHLSAVTLILVVVEVMTVWWYWPGCFSHANFDRIQPGMSREQVAELLGSPGEVTKSIPHHPPFVQNPGYPPGWTGAVWGDTYVHWQDGYRVIYVGFAEEQVASKYFWEPSF